MVAAVHFPKKTLQSWRDQPSNNLPIRRTQGQHPAQVVTQNANQVGWGTRTEVTVRFDKLPPFTTVKHLHKCFKKEGAVDFLELFETTDGRRDGRGLVRFR